MAVWGLAKLVRRVGRRAAFNERTSASDRTARLPLVDTNPPAVFFICSSLLALLPLFALALWSVDVEISAGRIGLGLAFSIIHVFLLWQLIRLGVHVQARVELSRTSVTVQPVIGRIRELTWSEVARVDDVKYVGPGVGGLYLYDSAGLEVVLDHWLPQWQAIRTLVRELTPTAKWTNQARGFLVG